MMPGAVCVLAIELLPERGSYDVSARWEALRDSVIGARHFPFERCHQFIDVCVGYFATLFLDDIDDLVASDDELLVLGEDGYLYFSDGNRRSETDYRCC